MSKIAIIEDDLAISQMYRFKFEAEGYDVETAENGRLGLELSKSMQPDVILLDLMMPEFDGFQVLDALQRLPAWRDVPVFIWTSMMLTDDEYGRLASSARTIISKGGGDLTAMLERLKLWQPSVRA